jgi:hypothetical protein
LNELNEFAKQNKKILGHVADYLAQSGIVLGPKTKVMIEVRGTSRPNQHLVIVSGDSGQIAAFFERVVLRQPPVPA